TIIRVLCGDFNGIRGPVDGIAAAPRYLDITVAPLRTKRIRMDVESRAFAYIFEGDGSFRGASGPQPVPYEIDEGIVAMKPVDVDNRSLVIFDSGDEIHVEAGDEGLRFLLVSGRPIREPVAWYGPIVMNTQSELQDAFREFQAGTFIRKSG
ncbi:MAG: pirin-like C-terminal cupin domain-containing protein, partial [Spirochaetota bacterium]